MSSSLQQAREAAVAASTSFGDEPSSMAPSDLDLAAASLSASRRAASSSASSLSSSSYGRSSFSGRGRGRGRSGPPSRGYYAGGRSGRGGGAPSSSVCRFFRQGRCNRGSSCAFRHTQEAAAEGAKAVASRGGFAPAMNNGTGTAAGSDGGGEQEGDPATTTKLAPIKSADGRRRDNTSGGTSSRRQYNPYIAEAIAKAKAAQDAEPRPYASLDGPFYSVDVECVASGTGHCRVMNRIPARVALVDPDGTTILDEIIKPPDEGRGVSSYLTPLTGLTAEACLAEGNDKFEEVVARVREKIPRNAVLVGFSIEHDIDWLGLRKGEDFSDTVDLTVIFRQRVPQHLEEASAVLRAKAEAGEMGRGTGETGGSNMAVENGVAGNTGPANAALLDVADVGFPTRYRVFSLRHCCANLLAVEMQDDHHDPAEDAKYSLVLFDRYRSASPAMLRAVRDALHRSPATPSFAQTCPVLDGVCISSTGYKYKHAARFIWKWWLSMGGGGKGSSMS